MLTAFEYGFDFTELFMHKNVLTPSDLDTTEYKSVDNQLFRMQFVLQ